MEGRERVIRAIEFRRPDRVPILHAIDPAFAIKNPEITRTILSRYPGDFAQIVDVFSLVKEEPMLSKGIHRDHWGVVWKVLHNGLGGQAIHHPLANLEALDDYEPPDPLLDPWFDRYERYLKKTRHDKYVIADILNLFERAQWLRGFKNLLMDILMGRPELERILDMIMDYNMKRIRRWCEMDVDGLSFFDDWGTQKSLMINPELWRRIFKARYEAMFNLVHKYGKFVHFHSDGYVVDIIPDLIGIGADTLNIQLSVIGVKTVGRLFSGKVCFISDVDRQKILPYGTPMDVKNHVKEIFQTLKRQDGGLIACGEIGPDVPPANAIAMYEAFIEYG